MQSHESFGRGLGRLRAARNLSQMQLALDAGVSTRHLSFLETGRAKPSPAMVLKLAATLGLPADESARLMMLAGYAPPSMESYLYRAIDAHQRSATDRHAAESWIDAAILIQADVDTDAATRRATASLSRLGIDRFFTGVLTPSHDGSPAEISFDELSHAPLAWLLHYEARQFRPKDRLITATASAVGPFSWADAMPPGRRRGWDETILAEARAFRIESGVVVPLRLPDGRVRAISCFGQRIEESDPRAGMAIRMIATALLEHHEARASPPRELSSTRLASDAADVLLWTEEGRTLSWMADRSGRSESDLRSVLMHALVTLGASDPIQAAMRARRIGLLPA